MTASSTHASFTGSIPQNYDTFLGPLLFEFTAADMAARVASATSGPVKVLEIACGTGISTRHLAGALPEESTILATDLNQAMLDHAAGVNGNLKGVSYSQADALDLPLDDESFDAVVCQFGIMFFPDRHKGMSEMSRVLKAGGTLALNVWDSLERNRAALIADRAIKQCFETDPPDFLQLPFGLHNREEALGLFRRCGYAEVCAEVVNGSTEVSEFEPVATGFVTGNPTIIEVEQRASISVPEVIRAVAAAMEDDFGPSPARLEFQAIAYTAQKSQG